SHVPQHAHARLRGRGHADALRGAGEQRDDPRAPRPPPPRAQRPPSLPLLPSPSQKNILDDAMAQMEVLDPANPHPAISDLTPPSQFLRRVRLPFPPLPHTL